MRIALVQTISGLEPERITQKWNNETINDGDFKIREKVIIKTDNGLDLGEIIKIEEGEAQTGECPKGSSENNPSCAGCPDKHKGAILRIATVEDSDKYSKKQQEGKALISDAKDETKKSGLPVKVIDVALSFDGGKMTVIFSAPKRVDFRELVKSLSRRFHKSIRMLQIGARDEAEKMGNLGTCGCDLCCKKFLKKLGNISSNFISSQQLYSRGQDRLTGICGRLKCCLAYEEGVYQEASQKFPALGEIVNTPKGKGRVIEWRVVKNAIVIETGEKDRFEVSMDDVQIVQ
jgi:cell fate regulator YaaT (PSP1 superfamily)